jgi:hypothetical protein
MTNFISLWHHFGSTLSRKMFRLVSDDREWMENSQLRIAATLQGLMDSFTPVSAVHAFASLVRNTTDNFEKWAKNFDTIAAGMRRDIDVLNGGIVNEKRRVIQITSGLRNESQTDSAIELQKARRMLDDYDKTMKSDDANVG